MAKTAKVTEEKAQEALREASATGGQNQPPQDDASPSDSKKQVSAQRVEFPEAVGAEDLDETSASSVESRSRAAADSSGKLDIILDMNVPITVAIGRTEMPVRRLLQLGPGSVLKLDKSIDAPADLFLKDAKFAEGDVVVVDERFAVRIKQIIGAGNGDAGEQKRTPQ